MAQMRHEVGGNVTKCGINCAMGVRYLSNLTDFSTSVHRQDMEEGQFFAIDFVMLVCIEKDSDSPRSMTAHQFGLISLQSRNLFRLRSGARQDAIDTLVKMFFRVPIICTALRFFLPN